MVVGVGIGAPLTPGTVSPSVGAGPWLTASRRAVPVSGMFTGTEYTAAFHRSSNAPRSLVHR